MDDRLQRWAITRPLRSTRGRDIGSPVENQPLGPPEIFFIKNTPPVQQNQKQRDIDPFQPHQLRNPGGKQPGAGGEGGNGKGNPIAGNDGKPPQTQGKIDQMGQKKTEEICKASGYLCNCLYAGE